MSQVTDYDIPGSPLTMAELATVLEEAFAALGSDNRGATAPSNPFEAMTWQDSNTTPVEYIKKYTVTDGWNILCSINITTGVVIPYRDGVALGDASVKTVGIASGNLPVVNQAVTDIASATNTTLGTTLNIRLTGTTTITGFTGVAGVTYHCRADDAFTLTYHATNLIITQGGASIVTAAGDTFDVQMITANTARIVNYAPAVIPLRLNYKTVDIGDWDMNGSPTKLVIHGVDFQKIRDVQVIIRDDAAEIGFISRLDKLASASNGEQQGGIDLIDSTQIKLDRLTGGFFDGVGFDSTSYNRGWVTICYTD